LGWSEHLQYNCVSTKHGNRRNQKSANAAAHPKDEEPANLADIAAAAR
jgi:hypothetical protein